MYSELAPWWPLISPPEDYRQEAEFYCRVFIKECSDHPRTVLELGSGGGHNACHLKHHFEMTLVDLSPEMLNGSRRLNPECEHLCGDMRSVNLDRLFDAVLVHDAIAYMTTETDLYQALATAFRHLRPGGVALFCPDFIKETFQPATDHGGSDQGVRGIRYLEWMTDPDPDDTTYTVDFAYLIREKGQVSVRQDQHILGLFTREIWLRGLTGTGFVPKPIYSPSGNLLFLGYKPRNAHNQ